jgi:hypothetical protein
VAPGADKSVGPYFAFFVRPSSRSSHLGAMGDHGEAAS